MTAKEIQARVIKDHLKPLMKTSGYQTSAQTWWKDKGDFYTLINLQNFSWNTKDSVDFCFNVGIVIKSLMKGKKPTHFELSVYLRESFFLPSDRQEYAYRNTIGYRIESVTSLLNFVREIEIDFIQHILPSLDSLNSLNECIIRFKDVVYPGLNLKQIIEKSGLITE